MRKKKKLLAAILISVFSFALVYFFKDSQFLRLLEMKSLDQRFQYAKNNVNSHPDVAVILIDESSLQTMKSVIGRWPWPRTVYKEVIDFLAAAGAKVVLFDILFTEPQVAYNQNHELGADDQNLVLATQDSGITVHAAQILKDQIDEYNKEVLDQKLPSDFIEKFSWSTQLLSHEKNNQYYIPFEELYQASQGIGVVEFTSDADGVYRTTQFLREYQGKFYPNLSLAAFPEWKKEKITQDQDWLTIGEKKIPLDGKGRYLINMKKNFSNFSMGGILATIQKINNGEMENLVVNPEELAGKIILIGGSAVGIEDLKYTSTGESVPGVYLHASLISNLLANDYINHKESQGLWAFFFLANLALVATIVFSPQVIFSFSFYLIFNLSYLAYAFYSFDQFRFWLPLIAPLLLLASSMIASFVYRSLTEGREKKFLKEVFGNYISPELISIMHEKEEAPKLGGDVGVRSAFFTDIQGFSSFSEILSADKLVELLNEYLSEMTEILLKNQGTLDKYVGDAIIAFFGAPLPIENHATRAAETAVSMQQSLTRLRQKWRSEGEKWPEIVKNMQMRIGINAGEIVTGNMGSKMRMNYTMMGDAVNLAARLESASKYYGVYIHVSEEVIELMEKKFITREIDLIKVVGKKLPVQTHEIICLQSDTSERLNQLVGYYQQALLKYKEKKWMEAIALFEKSLPLESERFLDVKLKTSPSQVYIERCRYFLENPPMPNWDGVFELEHK
jgi:adenylate cyclase